MLKIGSFGVLRLSEADKDSEDSLISEATTTFFPITLFRNQEKENSKVKLNQKAQTQKKITKRIAVVTSKLN